MVTLAEKRRRIGALVDDPPPLWPRKEDAACCRARVDADGRLPIGFCSPTCERRRPVAS